MGCYNCNSSDGTPTTLCPSCREERAGRDISIRSSINRRSKRLSEYYRFVVEEWPVVIGILVMLAASVNAVFWLVYGDSKAAVEAPWARAAPEEIYLRCLAAAPLTDTVDIDFEQIQQGYAAEIADYLQEHPEGENSRAEIIRHVLQIRTQQVCTTARDVCTKNPTSNDCRVYAEQYVM